jgi:hypothetical protein
MTMACGPMRGVHSFLLPHRPLLIIANSSSTRLHRPCASLQPQFRKIAIPLCINAAPQMQTGLYAPTCAGECRLALDGFLSTSHSSGDVFGAPCPPPPRPALTRPPARCFPCALRELRGSAFPVPSTRNLPRKRRAALALFGRDFLRLPSQKAPLALGSRAHSRRVAQGCPE